MYKAIPGGCGVMPTSQLLRSGCGDSENVFRIALPTGSARSPTFSTKNRGIQPSPRSTGTGPFIVEVPNPRLVGFLVGEVFWDLWRAVFNCVLIGRIYPQIGWTIGCRCNLWSDHEKIRWSQRSSRPAVWLLFNVVKRTNLKKKSLTVGTSMTRHTIDKNRE